MLPWQAKTKQRKSEVGGNCVRVANRRQSDSEDRRWSSRLDTLLGRHSHSGGIKVIQARDCQSKAFLLGFQRGYSLSRKRISPLPLPSTGGISLRTCAKSRKPLYVFCKNAKLLLANSLFRVMMMTEKRTCSAHGKKE